VALAPPAAATAAPTAVVQQQAQVSVFASVHAVVT